jgi:hypothetical protein
MSEEVLASKNYAAIETQTAKALAIIAIELPADMRQAIEYRHILGVPSKLAAYWMEIDDAAKFDHLVNRAKMRWLKLAEPRLAEWRNRD